MDSNKEELKKLESQYNKYMKIIKTLLLIILFVFIILLCRFIYLCYIHYNIIYHSNSGAVKNNCKVTSSTYLPESPENITSTIYYNKDGLYSMKFSDTFILFHVDDKVYTLNPSEKTYSVGSYEVEVLENYSFAKKFAIIFTLAYNGFTDTIRYETLEDTKYITISSGSSKAWYNADTFLLEKRQGPSIVEEYLYEFDIVTDKDITVPDLSEYTLEED